MAVELGMWMLESLEAREEFLKNPETNPRMRAYNGNAVNVSLWK